MAAPLGFKDFTTGEVLTANDVDGYLMQGIWVFASAAARDAAVTAPSEGNACYLKDTDVIMVYTGATWATQSASNPISANIVDAKGDLIAGTADNTVARLAVGANGLVLTANSAAATGLAWAAATITDISCRVYQTTTTSLSTTFASIAFGAENFDTDTMHDNTTNNSRITIKTAGKFSVGGQASTAANAALGVRILLNGTTVISRVFQGNSSATEGANVSTIYDFAVNDYIELQAALGSGTGTTSGDGTLQNFWAVKL